MTNNSTNVITRKEDIPNQPKERFSGVELLRIIAIFLICISHAIQTSEKFLDYTSTSALIIILRLFRHFGQIGNILFIICSSYFLLDSKGIKLNKLLKILLDSMFISIIIFIFFVIFGYEFSLTETIKQIFPDFFSNMWFIPIYILLYLLHPILNAAINNISQKAYFLLCFVIFALYGILGFAGWDTGISFLVDFIIIYFIVGYMKKYCTNFSNDKKKNFYFFLLFTLCFALLSVLRSLLKLNFIVLDHSASPILIPALLCLFNVFKLMNLKSNKINYLASCSLFVYCIHENILLRSIIRPEYYNYVLSINPNLYFIWIILCGFGMFIGGYILSLLYKISFSKITSFISKKLSNFIEKIINKVYNKFCK